MLSLIELARGILVERKMSAGQSLLLLVPTGRLSPCLRRSDHAWCRVAIGRPYLNRALLENC